MTFSLDIRLGDVLTLVILLGTVVGLYTKIRDRLTRIETRLQPLWNNYTDERRRAERRHDWPNGG